MPKANKYNRLLKSHIPIPTDQVNLFSEYLLPFWRAFQIEIGISRYNRNIVGA